MATRRQLEANRINAKRSTGPKTAAGKARSKVNAVTHGLSGATIVIGDEDPQEFDMMRGEMRTYFGAAGALEEELADQITGLLWRMRRIPRIEAAAIRLEVDSAEEGEWHDRLSKFQHGDEVDWIYNRFSDEEIENGDGRFAKLEKLRRKEDTPAIARRRQVDHALIECFAELPNLSRYNAALLNHLKRLLAILISLQSARREVMIQYQSIEAITPKSS